MKGGEDVGQQHSTVHIPLRTRSSTACSTSDARGTQKWASRCVTCAVSSSSVSVLLAFRQRMTAPLTALARVAAKSSALSCCSASSCLSGAATFARTRLCVLLGDELRVRGIRCEFSVRTVRAVTQSKDADTHESLCGSDGAI